MSINIGKTYTIEIGENIITKETLERIIVLAKEIKPIYLRILELKSEISVLAGILAEDGNYLKILKEVRNKFIQSGSTEDKEIFDLVKELSVLLDEIETLQQM